jgi:hypothetical protein
MADEATIEMNEELNQAVGPVTEMFEAVWMEGYYEGCTRTLFGILAMIKDAIDQTVAARQVSMGVTEDENVEAKEEVAEAAGDDPLSYSDWVETLPYNDGDEGQVPVDTTGSA